MESAGSSVRVFKGTSDFRVWRARVENELMRYHLLGYVKVRGYDGSQPFTFNGEEVPPRCPVVHVDCVQQQQTDQMKEETARHGAQTAHLSRWDVLGECAEAKSILQRFLHPDVESAILNKNVYDSWTMLCTLYDNRAAPGAHDVYEMHRVLQHMRLGDKKSESVREFITRWEMVAQQYAIATGIELTDGFRSAMFVQTLPRALRPKVSCWRGVRPFVPYPELIERVVTENERFFAEPEAESARRMIKAADTPTEKAIQDSAPNSVEGSVAIPAEKFVEKVVNPPPDKRIENAVTKPTSIPVAEPLETSADKPVQPMLQTADKPKQKQTERPTPKSTEVAAPRAAESITSTPQAPRVQTLQRQVPPQPAVATAPQPPVVVNVPPPPFVKAPQSSASQPPLPKAAQSSKFLDLTRGQVSTLPDTHSPDVPEKATREQPSEIARKESDKIADKHHESHREHDSSSKRDKYGSHSKYGKYGSSPSHHDHDNYSSYDKYDKHDKPSKYSHSKYRKSPASYDSMDHYYNDTKRGPISCFYCLKVRHTLRQCWFLKADIANHTTHEKNKRYSCTVTMDRADWMVAGIEKYIDEVNQARHDRGYDADSSDSRQYSSTSAQVSSSYGEVSSDFRELPPPSNYLKRSRSVFQPSDSRVLPSRDPRLKRSRSMYRNTDVDESFSPRKRTRAPSFERRAEKGEQGSPAISRRRRQHGEQRECPLELCQHGARPPLQHEEDAVVAATQRCERADERQGRHQRQRQLSHAHEQQQRQSGQPPQHRQLHARGGRQTAARLDTQGEQEPEGPLLLHLPQGKTQWVPPANMKSVSTKAKKAYNWMSEVEICFQEGRLGVSLREVHQMETILYPQFQAEVDDLPKINGKAGPAELHNWSVKPHKRLTIGMRVISIEDTSLAGLTYKEVVQKLKGASRPVRIKFADVAKGTVEENGGRSSDGNRGSGGAANDLAASGYGHSTAYMQQKEEYTRIRVTGELHTEMWTIENKKLLRSLTRTQHKWSTVSSEFDLLNTQRMDLRKENEVLKSDREKYETMMKNLKLQASFAMENPELVRANKLAKRNSELNEDISKMSSGNKRLRKERDGLQAQLDELEKQLAKVEKKQDEEEDRVPEEDIFGIDQSAPPKEQLSALKKKRRGLEDELNKEQRKANKVQKEMEQLIKHYASLDTENSGLGASTSSSSSHHSQNDEKDKSEASSSGHGKEKSGSSNHGSNKPKSEFAELETKILELRKKQRSVVDTLSKAAQSGDHKLAKECQRRRQKIKEELKDAQDELHRLKNGGKANSPKESSKEPSRSRKVSTEAENENQRSSLSKKKRSGSVNKDNLSSSTVNSSPDTGSTRGKMPMLSGFLDKGPTEWADRGLISGMKTMRGARERWCVITADGFLKYYKRRGDSVVRGEINLSDKSFEVVCEDIKRGKEFVICTDEQQSHFFTKSPQELNNWVKTLRAANAYLLNAAAPPLPPPRSTRGSDKRALASQDSKQAKEFTLDGLDDALPEEDEQFYGRATLGF